MVIHPESNNQLLIMWTSAINARTDFWTGTKSLCAIFLVLA